MLIPKPKARSLLITITSILSLTFIVGYFILNTPTSFAAREIIFPVLGGGSFRDDFTSPRSNGQHNATDIMAPKHTPLVAAVDGIITYVAYPQPSWGYMISIRDSENYTYNYIHINNDNDGTDDGNGGPMKAYGPDMKQGNTVAKGQHIGWVGDSGNAESTVSHLHFEIIDPSGNPINPYNSLQLAVRISHPSTYPAQTGELLPYGNLINTMTYVAAGNFDDDSETEFITGAGPGAGPHVRVFNNNYTFADYGFFAYADNYRGGVTVAAGDIDGDGDDEIITGTGAGSTTHVRLFSANGQYLDGFFAYSGYYTGVNVAAGDIDGDGDDEIVTGTGPNSSSHIKVFQPNGQLLDDFFAYPAYYMGVDVAAGDIDGDGDDEIVTSAGPGGGSHIKIFSQEGILENHFFAYPDFYGGVRIDVGNIRQGSLKEEIITAPYTGGGPDIRMFNESGMLITRIGLYESWWSGGYDVAAGTGNSKVGTGGNRRSSVRSGPQ